MFGALEPTGATGELYNEGIGTRVCVGLSLLNPGEEKQKLPQNQ